MSGFAAVQGGGGCGWDQRVGGPWRDGDRFGRYLAGEMKKPLKVWAGTVREGKGWRLEYFRFVQLS